MLKEIFEQPNIMRRIYKGRVNHETQQLRADAFHGLQHEEYLQFQRVACGTSYHSSRLGGLWIEEMTGIACRAHIASEYENRTPHVDDRTLHLFVSQS
jgi:glucosamine--fructose-6-phosphate aminotransferase (isomerizing)